MAVDVAPPTAPENKGVSGVRGLSWFFQSVMAELRKVTWPDLPEVRSASFAIIVFVLLLGLLIWFMDVLLQQLLVNLIPSLFSGR
jgi:preprotein translocase subunit SecE